MVARAARLRPLGVQQMIPGGASHMGIEAKAATS
jgi:hypothetical protein